MLSESLHLTGHDQAASAALEVQQFSRGLPCFSLLVSWQRPGLEEVEEHDPLLGRQQPAWPSSKQLAH